MHAAFIQTAAIAAVIALGMTPAVAAQGAPAQPSPQAAAFSEGVRLHDGGRPADAIPLFKQAVALGFQPINQAHFRLARAYAMTGRSKRRSPSSRGWPRPASPIRWPSRRPISTACARCHVSRRSRRKSTPTRVRARPTRASAPSISGSASGTSSRRARPARRSAPARPASSSGSSTAASFRRTGCRSAASAPGRASIPTTV